MANEGKWWAVCIALVLIVAICGATYGCIRTNDVYRELAGKCVDKGGTWIDRGQGSTSGYCLYPH